MFIDIHHPSVRFTGRWDIGKTQAITTTPGAMLEVGFSGTWTVLHFNMESYVEPYPHVWISVDDGARVEAPVCHVLRVEAKKPGNHVVRVIFKSAVETQHRWYHPLEGKLSFEGADLDDVATLPEDGRKILEFIGDSITEGVLIDDFYHYEKSHIYDRPYQDDATATYAYLTAMNLGMKPVIMGYGAVGVSRAGCGSVPRACESYPYNFAGSPITPQGAELIVINHGTNDESAGIERFYPGYWELLCVVRKLNPDSKIAALAPFCGAYTKELRELVETFNKEFEDSVYYIDSTGWLPRNPIHPLREGHRIAAEHLTAELKKILLG